MLEITKRILFGWLNITYCTRYYIELALLSSRHKIMSHDALIEVVFSIRTTRKGGMDWNGPTEKMSSLEHTISKADSKQAFVMPVAIFVKWEDLWRKMRYLPWPPNVPEMCVCRCHWLQKMTHLSMINIAWLRSNIKYSHSWHDNINMTKKGKKPYRTL